MVAGIRKVTAQPIRRVVVSHYHADHIYGLQAMVPLGAEVWAHREAGLYLASSEAIDRLAQRRAELFPWVDESTRLVSPDYWIDGETDFRLGGLTFRLLFADGAHSPEDTMMYVVEDRVLFAGDLLFAGRLPFVGNADSKGWLKAMDKMIALEPVVVVPGHGAPSTDVARDVAMTRDYLVYLRATMGRAVRDFESFEEAYAFAQANRSNAYGTHLLLEQEELARGGR
jgi:glyoxylase-like metal-dependent hydrolase (beta-lactamase superfamily II)